MIVYEVRSGYVGRKGYKMLDTPPKQFSLFSDAEYYAEEKASLSELDSFFDIYKCEYEEGELINECNLIRLNRDFNGHVWSSQIYKLKGGIKNENL